MLTRLLSDRRQSLEVDIAFSGTPPGELSNEALSNLFDAMVDVVEEIQGMKLLEAVEST